MYKVGSYVSVSKANHDSHNYEDVLAAGNDTWAPAIETVGCVLAESKGKESGHDSLGDLVSSGRAADWAKDSEL